MGVAELGLSTTAGASGFTCCGEDGYLGTQSLLDSPSWEHPHTAADHVSGPSCSFLHCAANSPARLGCLIHILNLTWVPKRLWFLHKLFAPWSFLFQWRASASTQRLRPKTWKTPSSSICPSNSVQITSKSWHFYLQKTPRIWPKCILPRMTEPSSSWSLCFHLSSATLPERPVGEVQLFRVPSEFSLRRLNGPTHTLALWVCDLCHRAQKAAWLVWCSAVSGLEALGIFE